MRKIKFIRPELKFVNEADIYDYKVEIGEDFIKVSSKNDSYIEKTTKDDI